MADTHERSTLIDAVDRSLPCSTFAAIFGTTRVVRAMVRSGRCGWYYRVIEAGTLGAGDGRVPQGPVTTRRRRVSLSPCALRAGGEAGGGREGARGGAAPARGGHPTTP